MVFELDPNYKQVPERINDFKAKHPEGCLRPMDPARPFWFETIEGALFLVYAAAAYRTPDDPTPGVGMAWEPVPGKTSYTKNSELQNAETSAWGRAIVAVLASESKAVASAEDIRNRTAERQAQPPDRHPLQDQRDELINLREQLGPEQRDEIRKSLTDRGWPLLPSELDENQLHEVTKWVRDLLEPAF